MARDKLSAIAFIAIILGAIGAGVGGYAAVFTLTGGADGKDGDNGDDGAAGTTTTTTITVDEYPCTSETEINNALIAIGTGYGKIMIVDNFNITSPIQINGGGNYIIEGTGLHILTCDGDVKIFDITNAKSCIIRDLVINASAITINTQQIIDINEGSHNPVNIESVQIIGDTDQFGIGIYVDSNNVWISNCYIEDIYYGIFYAAYYGHIYDNTITDCAESGMYLEGPRYTTVENNYIDYCSEGIYVGLVAVAMYCTIANNILHYNRYGILSYGMFNTITGNVITGTSQTATTCGIKLNADSDYNTIGNNGIYGHTSTGATGYGIWISAASCDENTVIGNTLLNNEVDFEDLGTETKVISEDVYTCSSEAEINQALTAIGSGNGKILITGDFNVTSTIQINGGGSYIIEGIGLPTITCDGDVKIFDITNAKSCIIRDLVINAAAITINAQQIIDINEGSHNPVYIESVQIIGDTDQFGIGIYVDSNNVWISNCYIEDIYYGIFYDMAYYGHIYDNTITECAESGMYLEGPMYTSVENNYIDYCSEGIYAGVIAAAMYCTIANNILRYNLYGILSYGMLNTIIGNVITGTSQTGTTCGIKLNTGSDYNTIGNNGIYGHTSTGATGYGIWISAATCDENTVVGNTALLNEKNFQDDGTATNATSNNFD